MELDDITGAIVDAAVQIHRTLGSGLLESVYEGLLACELEGVAYALTASERLAPVHARQVLTYLRLMNLRVGLLLNFGGETMREGVKRVVNNYTASSLSLLRVNQVR